MADSPHTAKVLALLAAGRVDEALDLLDACVRASDIDALVDTAAATERAGDAARRRQNFPQARRCYLHALDGCRAFASWSTSGGEGMQRTLAVERLQASFASVKAP